VGRNGSVHHTSRRGRGPSTQGKRRSTPSGRSSSQQGLTATCTDLVLRRQPRHEEGGGRAPESVGAKKAGEHLLTWSRETTMREGTPRSCKGALGTWQLQEYPDNGGPVNKGAPLEATHSAQGCMGVSTEASRCMGRRPQGGQGQNRTGEIPPSGIAGGHTETWAMEKAKRARKAETPQQPSRRLRLHAPYLYPDQPSGLVAHGHRYASR